MDRKSLKDFSTDGIDDLEANIKSKKNVMAVKEKPYFVYYGWKSFANINLVNSDNLPASTFKIPVVQ